MELARLNSFAYQTALVASGQADATIAFSRIHQWDLAAAEETRCALEINCHLDRLDVPSEILRRAVGRDVLFVISTDAHDAGELANTRWGVSQARRGWVARDQIVNTWDRDRFLAWVAEKRTL